MNWETKNLLSDLEVLKDRFKDLKDSHGWHFDEHYPYETNHVLNKDEMIKEGFLTTRDAFMTIRCLICYISIRNSLIILLKVSRNRKTLPDNNSLATKSDNA